jgi:hypothetical protein
LAFVYKMVDRWDEGAKWEARANELRAEGNRKKKH